MMAHRHDEIFKALADRHRRRILAAVCGEPMVAGELGRLVGLAPNAVSFHLKVLQSAGLVTVRREGRFLRFHANRDLVSAWIAHVDELLSGDGGASASDVTRAAPARPAPVKSSEPVAVPAAVVDDEFDEPDEGEDRLPTELL